MAAPTSRVSVVLAAFLLAGCAAGPIGHTAAPSASVTVSAPSGETATQSARAPATTEPGPTAITIQDDEPWILYQWFANDENALFLVRTDGRDGHEILTDVTQTIAHPDWSRDGKQIAFDLYLDDDAVEIWTANADGTDPKRLLGCEGPPCRWTDRPAWSPDGTRLAYVRYDQAAGDGPETGRASIEVFDRTTGRRRIVARPPAISKEYSESISPRWSPDGEQIVFMVTHEPVPPTGPLLGSSIAVVKADGSEANAPRILTDRAMFGAYPDWSPDGKRIVFTTYDLGYFQETPGASNLYTIRPNGTGLTQITHFAAKDTRATQPTWTPDGKQIIFTSVAYDPAGMNSWGPLQIGLIDADGSNLSVLDGQFADHPRLRPTP